MPNSNFLMDMNTNLEQEPPSWPPDVQTKLASKIYEFTAAIHAIFRRRLRRDVLGHPKNLLDFSRPITRCGPLSIF